MKGGSIVATKMTVRCTVDNCYFWGHDNFCEAESILITSDRAQISNGLEAVETNMLVDQIGETPANSCGETACKTFRKQG